MTNVVHLDLAFVEAFKQTAIGMQQRGDNYGKFCMFDSRAVSVDEQSPSYITFDTKLVKRLDYRTFSCEHKDTTYKLEI